MKQLRAIVEGVGGAIQLLCQAASYAATLPRQSARFIEQCYMIGYTTLPIVAILSFFIGTVLALEAGYIYGTSARRSSSEAGRAFNGRSWSQ